MNAATAKDGETGLECETCGQTHRSVSLRRGYAARCVRCDEVLARRARAGDGAVLPWALAAAALFVPAVVLPFVEVGKFGNSRSTSLLDAAVALWSAEMHGLGVVVLVSSFLAPLLLIGLLVAAGRGASERPRGTGIGRLAHHVQYWAMPEVMVLAVLVSFFKLGDVVDAAVGPGLWFYAGTACCTLAGWRAFRPGCARGGVSGP
ncbi:hypothetical protein ASA1KI_27350 [Opitutales bacterium ASA1]|uniref:paraquat-inducible protein A n=1 Tax=Congregicoccus parvus TaxID=3081749 RepID=UPI002B2C32A0|nr:hypothetical protein ASA1KI_27350 [Opitutales bacterium ASA1]